MGCHFGSPLYQSTYTHTCTHSLLHPDVAVLGFNPPTLALSLPGSPSRSIWCSSQTVVAMGAASFSANAVALLVRVCIGASQEWARGCEPLGVCRGSSVQHPGTRGKGRLEDTHRFLRNGASRSTFKHCQVHFKGLERAVHTHAMFIEYTYSLTPVRMALFLSGW